MTALFTLSSSFPVLAIVGKNEQFIADQLLGNRALCPKCAASKLFYKVPESNSEITSCLSINRQISQEKKRVLVMNLRGSVRTFTLVFTGKQDGRRDRGDEKGKFSSGVENRNLATIGQNWGQTNFSKLNKNLPTGFFINWETNT